MKSVPASCNRFAATNIIFLNSKKQIKMETKRNYRYVPSFGASYGTGWKVMTDNFLRLLLVVIVLAIVSGPMSFLGHSNWKVDPSDFRHIPFNMDDFFKIGAFGLAAAFMGLLALMYALLLRPVFRYGARMMFVQAARQITPDFEMLIQGFRKNYLNIVLANLLVTALVGIGLVCLFIPGIIIGCRLAFTAYLVMDRDLDPIRAAEESWRLTRGHGWKIFLMGFVAFFVYIAGFIFFFVGVFISDMWVKSAYATLYQSALIEKGLYQSEPVTVTAAPADASGTENQ